MVYEPPPLPIYFKIKRLIKQRISDGSYPVGSRIPSEFELSEEFGVNRLTVRHALLLLAQEGYLKRFRKRGTFVSKRGEESEELELQGFFDDLFHHVSKFETKKVQISYRRPPCAVADLLHLDCNRDKVKVIRRVRYLGDTPAAYTVNYLPPGVGSRIRKEDLYRMPLLQIFRDKLKIPLGEAFQTIEASIADNEVAKALEISLGAQVLLMQRTFYTKHGKPFDFVQTFYRSDKFRYFVRFRYDGGGNQFLLKR